LRGSYTIRNIAGEDIPFFIKLEGGDVVKDVLRKDEVVEGITNYHVVAYFFEKFFGDIDVRWVDAQIEPSHDWMKEGF
jgi:hypothetical protein